MFTRVPWIVFAAVLLVTIAGAAFAQDADDEAPARLEDASGRHIGRASVVVTSSNYGLSFKLWLDNGTRLRILYPAADARRDRQSPFTFRDYRVDPRQPHAHGDELGSGVATIDVGKLTPAGDTESFSGSMQLTARVVGDNDVPVTEPPVRFKIVLQ